jgi:transposase InsO family protein
MARCEADNVDSVEDKSRAPHTTVRQAWLPVRVDLSPLHTRHPDAGGFRLWSRRGPSDLSVRTVERIMAINRRVSQDLPGTAPHRAPQAEPQPQPCKATAAHEYGCIDGRMMDGALEGHRWWSRIILDGSSRTRLAGAVAPSEASGVALTVLSPACRRYGVPEHVMSDSGGAFISKAFAGVCTRLGIDHHTMGSTEGQSDMHLMETPGNIQRRL